jgi:hypothetical protein
MITLIRHHCVSVVIIIIIIIIIMIIIIMIIMMWGQNFYKSSWPIPGEKTSFWRAMFY